MVILFCPGQSGLLFTYATMALLLVGLLSLTNAYQHGDRIPTMAQTKHSGLKTPWVDVPLLYMPRFGQRDTVVFHTTIPSPTNETNVRLNMKEHLKLSLTFDHHKLTIPHLKVFDKNERKSLKKLTVRFIRDDFEVIRVDHEAEYTPLAPRMDPTHPTLRGFHIEYVWNSVQEEDFSLGARVMFTLAILFVLGIFAMVCAHVDFVEPNLSKQNQSPRGRGDRKGMTSTTASNRHYNNSKRG